MYFLLQYDRALGELASIDQYSDEQKEQAEEDRLSVELAHYRAKRSIEVVLLEAASRDALLNTHRRYFESVSSLGRLASS